MKNNILFFFLLFFGFSVSAKDVYDLPEIKPINNVLYPADSELAFKLVYFPVGAFNKHIGFGGSYLTLLSPNHGWDVLSAYYFIENASNLKKTVLEFYGAQPEDFPVVKSLLKTGYSYIPFYSKSVLFNSRLIHTRTFLNFSAGLADFTIEKPALVSLSYGQNFYVGENSAFKFELEYYHFFKNNKYIQNQMAIQFGYVFSWGQSE